MGVSISQLNQPEDRKWLEKIWRERWGGVTMVTRGVEHHLRGLDGVIAVQGGKRLGAATYRIANEECELMSLDAVESGTGLGTRLLGQVEHVARERGCTRVWLITTNDNVDALRFYQRRGYRIGAIHTGAVDEARQVKPTIPATGYHDIPIHDEIELEKGL
jgi:GNAT superfamily N-acetyltransferase